MNTTLNRRRSTARTATRAASRVAWGAYELVSWILMTIAATLVGTAIAVTIFSIGVVIEEQLNRPNLAMWTMILGIVMVCGGWVWWVCRPPSGRHSKRG